MNLLAETSEKLKYCQKIIEDIEYIYVYTKVDYDSKTVVCSIATPSNLDSLDFDYDNGYGSQEIFGWITFKDNSWLERNDYDGSEWWAYRRKPGVEDLI